MTAVPRELWPIVCRLATSREWPPQGEADVAAFFDYVNRQKLLALLPNARGAQGYTCMKI